MVAVQGMTEVLPVKGGNKIVEIVLLVMPVVYSSLQQIWAAG